MVELHVVVPLDELVSAVVPLDELASVVVPLDELVSVVVPLDEVDVGARSPVATATMLV
jgi:hypothetical protein